MLSVARKWNRQLHLNHLNINKTDKVRRSNYGRLIWRESHLTDLSLSFRFSREPDRGCRFPCVYPARHPSQNFESVDPSKTRTERERERTKGRKVTRPGDRPDQIRPGRTGRSRSHEIGEFNNLLYAGRGGGKGGRGKRGGTWERGRVGRGRGRAAIISGRYRSLIRHAARGNARLDLS